MGKHFLSFLFLLANITAFTQTRLQIVDDSVRITNGELIIRNSTRNVRGFLYNTGNGLTQFKAMGNGYQVTLNKGELDNAILSRTLTPGMSYRITGVDPLLYGGTDVIVQAETNSSISNSGSGLFYNPNYPAYEFYDTDSTYAVGDTATWGGCVWVNRSGNLGSITDAFTLSTGDWSKLPYDTVHYRAVWDDIMYNYKKNYIYYRKDNFNNEVACDSTSLESKWYYPLYATSPIKAFKWGSPKIYNNYVRDSYCEFINIDTASRVNGNSIVNRSYFVGNKVVNSYFVGNIFEQYVRVEANVWKNADISYNRMSEGYLSNNWVEGPYSYDFVQGASIFYNDIDKGSISGNEIYTTGSITNNAGMGNITNCYLSGGTITSNFFATGTINSDTLTGGGASINNNFISGGAGNSASISNCNLTANKVISGNQVLLTGKISRSAYGITGSSIQSYTLVPIASISSRTFIGGGSVNFPEAGQEANKLLTSDASGNASWSYPSLILGGTGSTSSIAYQTTSGVGATGADHIFKVGNNGATEAMRILNNGNVGVGIAAPSARLHLVGTTEQLRIGYDTANFVSVNVGSDANTVISANGTAAGLTLNGNTVTIQQGASNRMTFNANTSTTGMVNITGGAGTTANGIGFNMGSGTYSASSGMQYATALIPTINQSGSAGYTAMLISPRETGVGSGLKNLIDLGINTGGTPATHTSLFRVDNTGKIGISTTNTTAGTTGAQTINKPSGSVNFSTSSQTLVVTNSTVSSASMIFLVIEATDSTPASTSAYISSKSAGSFTIKLNAPASAETKVNFLVIN